MSNPNFDDIPTLQPDAWANASIRERTEALQRAENRMADDQNRPRCVVIDFAGSPEQLGRFDPNEPDVIQINQDLIKSDSPVAAVETVAHEGRHAYQKDCIDNPSSHPEAAAQIPEWSENFKPGNYLTPAKHGMEAYESQPVEADANAYAASIVNDLYPKTQQSNVVAQQDSASSISSDPNKQATDDWDQEMQSIQNKAKIQDIKPPEPPKEQTQELGYAP